LILSPNSESEVVREWLEQHQFMLEDEHFLEDKHKYYQLIIAKPGQMTLTPIEREFGPIILKKRNTTFQDHLNRMIYQLQSALNKTRNQSEQSVLIDRIKLLKGLIR
jgi:tRNA (adenine22-N1)-methyltransferase